MALNVLIVGSAGMGKSEYAKNFLLRIAPLYGFYFILDHGGSYIDLTRSFGVEPTIWRLDGHQRLNSLDTQRQCWSPQHLADNVGLFVRMTGVPAQEDQFRLRSAFLGKQLEQARNDFADDHLRRLSEPQRRAFIRQAMAVQQLAGQRKLSLAEAFLEWRNHPPAQSDLPNLTVDPDAESALWEFESRHAQVLRDLLFTTLVPEQQMRLSAFKEFLELNVAGPDRELARQLALLLEPYCGNGVYASLFDRPSNISLTGRIVYFELGQLPESVADLRALIAYLIVNQIQSHLLSLPREVRKLLLLEELSRILSTMPDAEKWVRSLYEQMRKTNSLVCSILQQISRITDASLRAAIIGNTPTYLIFNPGDRTDLALLAKDIGLSSVAQETILRYVRPAQIAGRKYSEFTYFHADPNRPVCGTVRHYQFVPPTEAGPSVNSTKS